MSRGSVRSIVGRLLGIVAVTFVAVGIGVRGALNRPPVRLHRQLAHGGGEEGHRPRRWRSVHAASATSWWQPGKAGPRTETDGLTARAIAASPGTRDPDGAHGGLGHAAHRRTTGSVLHVCPEHGQALPGHQRRRDRTRPTPRSSGGRSTTPTDRMPPRCLRDPSRPSTTSSTASGPASTSQLPRRARTETTTPSRWTTSPTRRRPSSRGWLRRTRRAAGRSASSTPSCTIRTATTTPSGRTRCILGRTSSARGAGTSS